MAIQVDQTSFNKAKEYQRPPMPAAYSLVDKAIMVGIPKAEIKQTQYGHVIKFDTVHGELWAILQKGVSPDKETFSLDGYKAPKDQTYNIDGKDITVKAGSPRLVAY